MFFLVNGSLLFLFFLLPPEPELSAQNFFVLVSKLLNDRDAIGFVVPKRFMTFNLFFFFF